MWLNAHQKAIKLTRKTWSQKDGALWPVIECDKNKCREILLFLLFLLCSLALSLYLDEPLEWNFIVTKQYQLRRSVTLQIRISLMFKPKFPCEFFVFPFFCRWPLIFARQFAPTASVSVACGALCWSWSSALFSDVCSRCHSCSRLLKIDVLHLHVSQETLRLSPARERQSGRSQV